MTPKQAMDLARAGRQKKMKEALVKASINPKKPAINKETVHLVILPWFIEN